MEEACQQVAATGCELQVDRTVVNAIAQAAMAMDQGARPVQQLVRQHILAPLSKVGTGRHTILLDGDIPVVEEGFALAHSGLSG